MKCRVCGEEWLVLSSGGLCINCAYKLGPELTRKFNRGKIGVKEARRALEEKRRREEDEV